MITSRTKKVKRTVRLIHGFEEGNGSALLSVTITSGRKTTTTEYWLDRLPVPFGQGYVIAKRQVPENPAEDFAYRLAVENDQDHACDCKGHQVHGHCKHVELVLALCKAGKI